MSPASALLGNGSLINCVPCSSLSPTRCPAGKATKASGSVPAIQPTTSEDIKAGEVIIVDESSGILAQMYSGQTLAVTTLVNAEGT